MIPLPFQSTTPGIVAVILGGGAGTRLFPLTKDRSKPAVPLGGKYRLVDVPISNCLNSGLRRIYLLTQFNSNSLHRHIQNSYKFDHFSHSFVDLLAAQQTPRGATWYQGTADAVRQNLGQIVRQSDRHFLILSGDQLYRMDFREVIKTHAESGADLTIATIPVNRPSAQGFGIMQTDREHRIERFVEKPADPDMLAELRIPESVLLELGKGADEELYLASMGIYLFNRDVLLACLDNDLADFGKHIIPSSIGRLDVRAHIFQGYWEDIGTIKAFFNANLALTEPDPAYSFFESRAPVYTHPRFLPGSKLDSVQVNQSIVSEGCIVSHATVERCLVGIRSVIGAGSTLRNTIMMGADLYEEDLPERDPGVPPMGIGRDCVIQRAIIDKNARIGDAVVISPDGKPADLDAGNYYVRDGIVVIPKNAVIPNGQWI